MRPPLRRIREMTLVAVVVPLVTACGAGAGGGGQQAAAATVAVTAPPASPSPSDSSPDAPQVTIPASLIATWTVAVSAAGPTPGVWTLRATPHDLQLRNPIAGQDEFFGLNPVRVTDVEIDFGKDPDCDAAQYTWHVTGDRLTLMTASDTCGDRHAILTAGTWTRQP